MPVLQPKPRAKAKKSVKVKFPQSMTWAKLHPVKKIKVNKNRGR